VALIVNNIVPLATARANALIPFWSQAAVRIKHRMQAQSDAEMLKETLPTLVECYIMQRIHGTIHPWFQHQCAANEARMGDLLHQLRHLSPHDCGVRPPFQCSLDDAAAELSTLAAAVTPLEKLLVLKNTVRSIQSAVQRSLFRKSTPTPATAEEEYPTMATDDLVLLIVYTVILSAPHTSSLLSEIHYIKTFHFVPMSTSHLGFILSTFEVAASWFTAKIPDFEQIEIGSGENADDTTTSSQFEEVPAHLKSIPRSITIEACRRNVHGLSADAAVEEEDGEQEFDFWKNSLFTPSKRGGDHFGNISSPNSFLLATTSFLSPMALKFGGEDASSKQEEHDPVQHGLVLLSRRETSMPGDVGISCASSDNGQLPQGDGKALSPLQLQFDKSAALAAAGESSTQAAVPLVDCAIGEHCFAAVTTNGALLTWGVSKNHSCLGHGGESESSAENQDLSGLAGPTRVVGKLLGTTVAAVACGDGHVLALLTRGAVYSWGENDWGQLGTDGGGGETEPSRGAPAHIAALESYQVISIACGARHSLAVTNAGQVYSWGMCKCGQLGRLSEGECHKTPRSLHDDDDDDDDLEEAVEKGTSVDGADTMDQENKSRRGRHTVPERIECDWVFRPAPATTAMGKQPKKEDSKQQPTVSSSVAHAIAVTAGSDHSIVITSEGAAYSFGCGLDGRLGHGCHSDAFHPIQVRALAQLPDLRIVGAAAGAAHSLFRTADGALFGCGSNRFGQVGVHTELHGEVHDHAEAGAAASDTASSPAERGSVLVPLRILGELDGLTAVDITAGSWHSVATMEASSGPNTREKKQGDADLVHSNIARMLFAWGSNLNGRLGIGSGDAQVSMVDEPREIKVATRRLSVAVAGGQHTAYFDITPEAHRIAQARRHGREGGWGGEKS
jgi:alpha-tubulin suppressor-like RCC1 family protein